MRGFVIEPIRAPSAPKAWWVNQGASYQQEKTGGFLWAPVQGRKGNTFAHWANMEKVREGDIVLHYANVALRAVSVVTKASIHAAKPDSHSGEPWEDDGYLVRSDYSEFASPIPLHDIPLDFREGEVGGPFNREGNVNQGYLYPAPAGLLDHLVRTLGVNWPDPVVAIAELDPVVNPVHIPNYVEPAFETIHASVKGTGLRISDRTLRRYHLSLITRGFVILAGVSGTGKTWLAEVYADSVDAEHTLVSVAPNWTTNEDLLGYFNPVTNIYHDTRFSRFIREASDAHYQAKAQKVIPHPYHLILDEMNLARVEYYFASFLSAMEVRARYGHAVMDIGGGDQLELTPNLKIIGTVNIDETTHGFADKVWDRAQLVELDLQRDDLALHLADAPYQDALLKVWDTVLDTGPFAYRVVDEIAAYVDAATSLDVPWEEALDEQILQKILPKLKGGKPAVGQTLEQLIELLGDGFPLSSRRVREMHKGFIQYGFTSYFG